MRGKKKVVKNKFKKAVESTSDIDKCYQVGLKGFGGHSAKISLSDHSLCEGSVDLDGCLSKQKKYPNDNRWDYIFSYKSEVYFVEVHSAYTGEVSTVVNKLNWLKQWLNVNAPQIKKLMAKQPYFWIQSGSFQILPNSRQSRLANQNGILPIKKLTLK